MSPYALGLGWAVKLDKGPFEGRDALAGRARERRPPLRVVGLEVPWEPIEALYLEQEGVMPDLPLLASREPVPVYDLAKRPSHRPRHHARLVDAAQEVHRAGDGRGAVGGARTEVGLEMTVRWRRRTAPARVVRTPFFRPERARR